MYLLAKLRRAHSICIAVFVSKSRIGSPRQPQHRIGRSSTTTARAVSDGPAPTHGSTTNCAATPGTHRRKPDMSAPARANGGQTLARPCARPLPIDARTERPAQQRRATGGVHRLAEGLSPSAKFAVDHSVATKLFVACARAKPPVPTSQFGARVNPIFPRTEASSSILVSTSTLRLTFVICKSCSRTAVCTVPVEVTV